MIMQTSSKTAYEAELLASLTKFYQTYDRVMSDYDRLYDIIDLIREDYDNSKFLNLYQQYKELQRVVKSSLRRWQQLETKASTSSFSIAKISESSPSSNSLSSTFSSNSLKPSDACTCRSRFVPRVPSASSFVFVGGDTFTHNISARLTAQKDLTTRELYEECTRLERDIFQYKTKSSHIEEMLAELADTFREFNKSQGSLLHKAKGYKQLKNNIKKVVLSDA